MLAVGSILANTEFMVGSNGVHFIIVLYSLRLVIYSFACIKHYITIIKGSSEVKEINPNGHRMPEWKDMEAVG